MGYSDAKKEAVATDQLQKDCRCQLARAYAALVHHRGSLFRVHAGQMAGDKPLDDTALFLFGHGIGIHQPIERVE